MKIYDCFNFFNELDILEIRLNIMYDVVDYFVLIESSVTHSGEEKPFYFENNKERYSRFLDKIIHYKVYDTPHDFSNLPSSNDPIIQKIFHFIETQTRRFDRKTQPDYGRDFYQKECVRRPLINCSDDDIILFSDLDEIPNPKIFSKLDCLDLENSIYSLNQPMYYYHLNVLRDENWQGTKMSLYKNIKDVSFNEIRNEHHHSILIKDGGWHFSFMGGVETAKTKLLSYSARDMVDDEVLRKLENNIKFNIDPFFGYNLRVVEIDSSYPEYILNNLEKYKHLIKDDRLNLENITLIAVSSVKIEETIQALLYSCQKINFKSVKLLTDADIACDGIEVIKIGHLANVDEYSKFMIYELSKFVDTEYAMTVQHDGFIINPSKWDNKFLEYDYIGAPWPLPSDNFSYRDPFGNIVRVGNGGFSLRSKKLMDLPNMLDLEWKPYFGFYNEDGFLAIHNKHILEEHGCKFAPINIAALFSQEIQLPETEGIIPFGFHKFFPK